MTCKLKRLLMLGTMCLPGLAHAQDGDPVPDCGLYLYKAEITRVIDGDTVVADIDLGFHITVRDEYLRLAGLDTPEIKTDEGAVIAEELRSRIEGKTIYICTIKMARSEREKVGKYGRYLAVLYEGGENLNDWLLETGRASPDG